MVKSVPRDQVRPEFVEASNELLKKVVPQCHCMAGDFGLMNAVVGKYDQMAEDIGQMVMLGMIQDAFCPEVIKVLHARIIARIATDLGAVLGDWDNIKEQYVAAMMGQGDGRLTPKNVGSIDIPEAIAMLGEIYTEAVKQLKIGAEQAALMNEDERAKAGLAPAGNDKIHAGH